MTEAATPNPAEGYERYIVRNIFVPWTADLVRRAAPRKGERLLDLACGTGIVTRHVFGLVMPGGRVTGLDLSPMMLAVAESLGRSAGIDAEWHEGSGTAMPFSDGSFDLVLCQQGLQFFPDHQLGLREMHRVLVPGGRATVSVWRDFGGTPFVKALDAVLSKHGLLDGWDKAYALSDAAHLELLARNAGFTDATVWPATLTIHSKDGTGLAQMMFQGAATFAASASGMPMEDLQRMAEGMAADLADAMQRFMRDDEIVFDTSANVLVARR